MLDQELLKYCVKSLDFETKTTRIKIIALTSI